MASSGEIRLPVTFPWLTPSGSVGRIADWEPAIAHIIGFAGQKGALVADPIRVSGPISGTERTLSFETGHLAPQSQRA